VRSSAVRGVALAVDGVSSGFEADEGARRSPICGNRRFVSRVGWAGGSRLESFSPGDLREAGGISGAWSF
jgi:hypothetical protein